MPMLDDVINGDKVRLLTHKDKAEYEVLGVQFIYSDFAKNEGKLHARLLTKAHGQEWFALVPQNELEAAE